MSDGADKGAEMKISFLQSGVVFNPQAPMMRPRYSCRLPRYHRFHSHMQVQAEAVVGQEAIQVQGHPSQDCSAERALDRRRIQ